MCMCTCTLTCGRLSLQILTLLTFVEMCVRSSVTRILVRRLERILLHAPPSKHLAILLPELHFLNQNLYTSEKRVIGMCLPKGLTTKRDHFSVSTFVSSDCSILRSGL